MKFPLKIDPFDEMILIDLKKNFDVQSLDTLWNIDEYLWNEEHLYETDLNDDICQEEIIMFLYGGCYKIDKEGKVVLIWYALGADNPWFPILKKIPENLLELSHLKYVYLLCDVDAIEKLPKNIKNNDKFEVIVEPLGSKSSPLAPNKSFAYHICQQRNEIDEDQCFELIIVRKDLIKEITSQKPSHPYGYISAFLKNEMFKRSWD